MTTATKLFLSALLILVLALANAALADEKQTLSFTGQFSDKVLLDLMTKETRYRTEMQDSTCSRQVPIGSHQVCSPELRYRQECYTTPPRTECYTTPPRQECRPGPSREECTYVPGREICRTGRDGRTQCYREPDRRVCRTIPGPPVCYTVPAQTQCRTIPGTTECRQVPYYETVCHYETDYRTEYYTCQKPVQVPYTVDVYKKAQVDLSFANNSDLANFDLYFTLNDKGEISVETPEEDLIIFSQEIFKNQENQGNDLIIKKKLKFTFKNKKALVTPFKSEIRDIKLSQDELSFTIGRVYDSSVMKFAVSLYSDPFLKKKVDFKREFRGNEIEYNHDGENTVVRINLRSFDLPKRKYELTLNAQIDLAGLGEALNLSGGERLSRTENLEIKNH